VCVYVCVGVCSRAAATRLPAVDDFRIFFWYFFGTVIIIIIIVVVGIYIHLHCPVNMRFQTTAATVFFYFFF